MNLFGEISATWPAHKRLYQLRCSIFPNRKEFCKKYNLSLYSLFSWENDKRPLTPKSVDKLIKIFNQEGVLCTIEWILYGTGSPPIMIKDFTSSLNLQPPLKRDENTDIQSEIDLFVTHYSNAKVFKMQDDSMEITFFKNDFVGGVLAEQEDWKSLFGKPAIVIDQEENCYIRSLIPIQNKNNFNLSSLNPRTISTSPVLYNIHPREIYKIVWIRRK